MIPLPPVTCHISVTSTPFCSRLDLDHSSYYRYYHQTLLMSPSSPYHPHHIRLQYESSNLSCFPRPNSCDCLPRPVTSLIISPSIAHTTNLACTFAGSGRRNCLGSLRAPTVTTALAGFRGWIQPTLVGDHSVIQ